LTREATVAPASSSTNPKLTRRDIAGSSWWMKNAIEIWDVWLTLVSLPPQ
jgi:hypothetical protein